MRRQIKRRLALKSDTIRVLGAVVLVDVRGGRMDETTAPGTGCPFQCWPDPP